MQDTIAVVFDFDDTLAPDSTSSFLHNLGLDVPEFWQKRVQPLIDAGWDPIPAYLYMMIKESETRPEGQRITRRALASWGSRIKLYDGVTRIFSRLERHAKVVASTISIEFYLISSGIGEILRATKVTKHFKDIWACDFNYNNRGEIVFPRNVVSFTDKTRYLFNISKGLTGPKHRGKPFDVNKKIAPQELRVPFDQMVFVGDGYTDVPCFSMLRKVDGVAIGVYDNKSREKWGRAWGFIEDGRVSNLVPADYRKNSALENSLMMAIEAIGKRILVRQVTYQG
jgi:phosphoserine phosphatase